MAKRYLNVIVMNKSAGILMIAWFTGAIFFLSPRLSAQSDMYISKDRKILELKLKNLTKLLTIPDKDKILYDSIHIVKSIAKERQWYYLEAKTWLLEARYYFSKQQWDSCYIADNHAYNIGKALPEKEHSARIRNGALGHIADMYSYMGDYASAIDYRLQAHKIIEKSNLNDITLFVNSYKNLANNYRNLRQFDKSLEYIKKGEPYLSRLSGTDYLDFISVYVRILRELYDYKKISELLRLYDAFLKKNGAQLSESDRFVYLSTGMALQGDYELKYTRNFKKALNYHQYRLQFAKKSNYLSRVVSAMADIGITYDSLQQYNNALSYLTNALDSAIKYNLKGSAIECAKNISQIYARLNEYKPAFVFNQIASELRDSLNIEERVKAHLFQEALYQSTKKENEINELKLLNTQIELRVKERNKILWVGGVGLVALAVIFGISHKTNRQNRIIAEKEHLLQTEKIKTLEQQQQVLSLQAMVEGQESERARIAKELHDSMGGLFSTLKMYINALGAEKTELNDSELFNKSKTLLNSASEEIRRIAHDMIPEILIKFGLIDSVREYVNNIHSAGTINITLQHFGMEGRPLPVYFERILYRIIQELVNNILKHADASEAIIQIIREDARLSMTFEDNGKGFDVSRVAGKSAGLELVKDRVNYLKGHMSIESELNIGTSVMIEFYLEE